MQVSLLVAAPIYLVSIVGLSWLLDVMASYFGWYIPSGRVGMLSLAVTMFVVLFVPYLVARYVHHKVRWRRLEDANLCVACGYDLTGNVSGRCPECGTACQPLSPR